MKRAKPPIQTELDWLADRINGLVRSAQAEGWHKVSLDVNREIIRRLNELNTIRYEQEKEREF